MLPLSVSNGFSTIILDIEIDELDLKDYPAYYAKHIIAHLNYYVSIYQQVIDLAIRSADREVSSLTVLDFGCGNGFLGLFAKYCGFKQVWLCDLSQDFLQAAEKTAQAGKFEIDGFIQGDIDSVREYFRSLNTQPDIILSTDVIEHIYDLEQLFQNLKKLNPNLISVFTTASNPYNFRKVKMLHKEQYKDEWIGHKDLSEGDQIKKGFSPLSFFEQRKEIIRTQKVSLTEETVAELARLTRGKKIDDILESVRNYLDTGNLPRPPADLQWVCDPYTGSWTERILPIKAYEEQVHRSGFGLNWVNGFYNPYSRSAVSAFIVRYLNRFIRKNKGIGKYVAPYIVLIVKPVKVRTEDSQSLID